MLTAVVLLALSQVSSTVSLDPVPTCTTCDALMARVAALEARLAATPQEEPPRRVRLIEVSRPARRVIYTYAAPPVVTYSAPLGEALPTLAAWAPGYTAAPMPRFFGPRFFGGGGFSSCGPGGCR